MLFEKSGAAWVVGGHAKAMPYNADAFVWFEIIRCFVIKCNKIL